MVDAGNAHFPDTIRREAALKQHGLHFVGTGVSGGEEGALNGPSIMPGGTPESYESLGPILEDISAKVDGAPCCTYVGSDGAGHFVKMDVELTGLLQGQRDCAVAVVKDLCVVEGRAGRRADFLRQGGAAGAVDVDEQLQRAVELVRVIQGQHGLGGVAQLVDDRRRAPRPGRLTTPMTSSVSSTASIQTTGRRRLRSTGG